MLRGALSVSAGSTIARSGSIRSSRRLTFRCCSGTLITAFLVTSAPVPAVVGDRHERQGTGFQLTARSHHLQIVDHRAGGGDQRRNRLTGVNHRAAAEADHRSDPAFSRASWTPCSISLSQGSRLIASVVTASCSASSCWRRNAARCGLAPCTSRIGPPCCASQRRRSRPDHGQNEYLQASKR